MTIHTTLIRQVLLSVTTTVCVLAAHAQSNSLPENGSVGIGTTTPEARLDVRGSARIDSSLTVMDSMIVDKSAHVKEDLVVEGSSRVAGMVIGAPYLKLDYLRDSTLLGDEVLIIDSLGRVVRGDLKSLVYASSVSASAPCKDNNGGYTTPASPVWLNGSGKLYTSKDCVPNVKVGIGLEDPVAKLHIRTNEQEFDTHPLIVENSSGFKLLQLTEDALLQAREVKVDLASWPDYVFEPGYALMPLEELDAFVRANGHLPNVQEAAHMCDEGMNISETSVLLLEKVEELTLYILQLQAQIDRQQKEIDALKTNR